MGRRVFCLILVLMILLSLAACGKISKDKAADIALEKLGLSRITTTRIDTERTAVAGKDADRNCGCTDWRGAVRKR